MWLCRANVSSGIPQEYYVVFLAVKVRDLGDMCLGEENQFQIKNTRHN